MVHLLQAFQALLTPLPMFYIFIGVFLGCTVGAIPGLTGSMLIALTLPLTYYMSSVNAITLLVSMYIGAVSGGLITATLLRIPGTPASVVTTFDGYPLARSGHSGRAIGVGIMASFVGGLIAWIFLVLLSPLLARFALRFSSFELFSLVLMALVLIAAVGQGSILRAVVAGFLGLLVGVPGVDPIVGRVRMTFGSNQMIGGFGLLPVLIGLFGISQILNDVSDVETRLERIPLSFKGMFLSLKELKENAVNLVRSSLIGTWVGILPGVGATIGSIMAYWAAKSSSKHPEMFGKGSEEGIIASEAANNATINGAIIPLITLGIPGSIITAIMLGAFILHDLNPGPLLFTSEPEIVYGIMATAFVANIVMFVVMIGGSMVMARLIDIPRATLLPLLIVFCVIGTFALNNRIFDVWVMFAFGLVGFVFEKADVPLGPFIIGFILSGIAEVNLRSSLMYADGSLLPFFTRPISLVFIIIAFSTLGWTLYRDLKGKQSLVASAGTNIKESID